MPGPTSPQSFLEVQKKDDVLRAIKAPVAGHLDGIQAEVQGFFDAPSKMLDALSGHVFSIPGKKFRPTLLMLVAGMGTEITRDVVRAAAMVELVHTATLIHDDSIDRSLVRRGLPTINNLWNDRVAVILGDYIYTKAFEGMVLAGHHKPVAVLSRTAHRMSLGEILAMEQKADLGLSEESYFLFISEKTASLISAACEIGATYAFDDEEMHDRFQAFGNELGLAYQIADDLFDYEGNADALGKEIGSDLKEGKITLPIIRALPGAPREIHDIVARAVDERTIDRGSWDRLVGYLRETDAFDYCRNLADEYADRARSRLEGCPEGPCKDALSLAVDFAVKRSH